VLKELGKNITPEQVKAAALAVRQAGINLSIYLITGVTGETEEDLKATCCLIEEIKPSDGQISPLAYYPGTALFEKGVLGGAVRGDIFESARDPALFVRDDPAVAGSTKTLLAKLERVAKRSRFTAEEFRSQKSVLGHCHATNVLAGEFFENAGRWRLAEAEYREIVEREPANPWGWLLLGELYSGMEIIDKAGSAFAELLRLVPKHAPAYVHLGELHRRAFDYDEAERLYMQALSLDPGNVAAKKGLAAIHRRTKN
jgi:tetratricopeptide (TPR) repeat protein